MKEANRIKDAEGVHTALMRDRLGPESFTTMVRSWMARSGWSLQVLADLCETSLRYTLAKEVPDFIPGEYVKNDLVVANSNVWRATRDLTAQQPPNKNQPDPKWEKICSLRRLYPSQLHNVQLGSAKLPSATVFDVLGQLNLYLAAIRTGSATKPTESRLLEKATQATVIEDSDGPFGPEEMFAVYIGRLEPPFSATRLSEKQANALSQQLARRIRQGMMEAGLDLVDDWSRFIAVYPTGDANRLAKVRDVAMGQGQWSAEQVEDEEQAVGIALRKLKAAAGVPD